MKAFYQTPVKQIQPRLTMNKPGDKFEQEADSMADKVVGNHFSGPSFSSMHASTIQRKCSHCEEEEKKRIRRKESNNDSTHISTSFSQALQLNKDSGNALAAHVAAEMGSAFSADFSSVRIHTNDEAAQMSQAINANAFTYGSDIYFNHHKYAPNTISGKHLLAHELTHVIQQQSSSKQIQRDFAIGSVATGTTRTLSGREIIGALAHNRTLHRNAAMISELRDVLGIDPKPAVIDEDFVEAVRRFQEFHGITQDGRLGQITTMYLAEELEEEGLSASANALRRLHRDSLDINNTSHCNCRARLQRNIDSNNEFITEYRTCGADPANRTGTQIENCVEASFLSRGIRLRTAGSTSSSGAISVTRSTNPCGQLLSSDTFHHEWSHETHRRELIERFGDGTPRFNAAFEEAGDWVSDEINARLQENNYLRYIIQRLNDTCP